MTSDISKLSHILLALYYHMTNFYIRAVVFQLNLKYIHVKITKLLRVVV